jgi:hypothetical protein
MEINHISISNLEIIKPECLRSHLFLLLLLSSALLGYYGLSVTEMIVRVHHHLARLALGFAALVFLMHVWTWAIMMKWYEMMKCYPNLIFLLPPQMQRFTAVSAPMNVGASRWLDTHCISVFGDVLCAHDLVTGDTFLISEPPSTLDTEEHVPFNTTGLHIETTRTPMTTERVLIHVVVSALWNITW